MIDHYFTDYEVKSHFHKEFVSLFNGWLGEANYYRLDEVTEPEWGRFSSLLRMVSNRYEIFAVDLNVRSCSKVSDIESFIPTYEEDMDRESAQFTRIIIPKLGAVYTEHWDYTWILWHQDKQAVDALAPMIAQAGLFHFHNQKRD